MEEEWAEGEERLGRLEARMQEFVRQLQTGHLQNRAARKLTNDAGEEVVRCRCVGSFGRQMLLVPLRTSLSRLIAQINKEVDLGVEAELEVFYIDTGVLCVFVCVCVCVCVRVCIYDMYMYIHLCSHVRECVSVSVSV